MRRDSVRGTAPPPAEFFSTPRPRMGEVTVGIELGQIRIDLEGLDVRRAAGVTERFGPYCVRAGQTPGCVRIRIGQEDREFFIEPPTAAEIHPVLVACDGARIRFMSYQAAGWFDTESGDGGLLLSRGEYEPLGSAIENYVRVVVGWQAATLGGALVHAASIALNGRGYLFYGASGAGKSTLAAVTTRGEILSDDLSLVLPDDQGSLDVIGTPFRGTFRQGKPVVGRFPLVAGFRLIKASEASVETVARSIAMSELVGNLPFVAEFFSVRPDLFQRVDRAFQGTPLRRLHFRKDDSYWDALTASGL